MAISWYPARLGPGSAVVKVFPDGSIKLYVGVIDIGTGAKTVMAMIAAETLGVPLESVAVVYGDTDATPYNMGESGSRCTGQTGYAVMEGAGGVRVQLLAHAATQWKVTPE